jgi:precorrin-8X/cobalt-precorrin-8 methylmutase
MVGAALQFNHPDLGEAVESLAARKVERIVVAPYFLFTGRHLTEDIPEDIAKLQSVYPDIEFIVTGNLGMDSYFIELMARRIKEACPDLTPEISYSFDSPDDIEKQSMDIIENLLPRDITGEKRTVVKRIIHACGDPHIAPLIKFSPTAIATGLQAIKRGCAIYTDVRMAATGISSRLVQAHGCTLHCALDEIVEEQKRGKATTRSAAAIYSLGAGLNHAIAVIGNAPTALLALIDMIDNESIIPSLVVGMPVGFVQAAESKAELMKRDIPCIAIEGNRGGSALAAATVNALLRLAD